MLLPLLPQVQTLSHRSSDSFIFFDDEVKNLKKFAKRVNDEIKQVMGAISSNATRAMISENILTSKLTAAEAKLRRYVWEDPTPEELYQLYSVYEAKVKSARVHNLCYGSALDEIYWWIECEMLGGANLL